VTVWFFAICRKERRLMMNK